MNSTVLYICLLLLSVALYVMADSEQDVVNQEDKYIKKGVDMSSTKLYVDREGIAYYKGSEIKYLVPLEELQEAKKRIKELEDKLEEINNTKEDKK